MSIKIRIKEKLDQMMFWPKIWLRSKLNWLRSWIGPDEHTQMTLAEARVKIADKSLIIEQLRLMVAQLNDQLRLYETRQAEQSKIQDSEAIEKMKLLYLWLYSATTWRSQNQAKSELLKLLNSYLPLSPLEVEYFYASPAARSDPKFKSIADAIVLIQPSLKIQ